ncbi:benzoate-CoA ligase family protein [Laceyella tengchongensis]
MKSIYDQISPQFNVASYFLEKNLTNLADKTAIYYKDQKISYAELYANVRKMASLLKDLQIDWENRICIYLPDCPSFVYAFWGAIWIGAVPVAINVSCKVSDVEYMLTDARAKLLITTKSLYDGLSRKDSPFLKEVLLVDDVIPLESRLWHYAEDMEAANTSRDDVAFWLYTSGSTGRPKGVIHLHHDMVVCAETYAKNTIHLTEQDVIYSVANMPFAYGLGNSLYFPLHVGASVVLSDAENVFDVIDDIHRYRPTVFFGLPFIYASILAVDDIAPFRDDSVRLFISAAEQLPPTIWRKWNERYGKEICEGIGTTELLHIFLSNTPGDCRPGSTGKPVNGYEIKLLDPEGNELPPGHVGDLVVAGESLMQGYWNRHRETREAICGESMRTGDRYYKDEDGYYYFVGRNDDCFKVNGQWIIPFEIEDALLRYADLLDAAVIPEQDERGMVMVAAYVCPKANDGKNTHLEQELRKVLRSKLPAYKVPQRVYVIEKLPRTSTGKIDRKRLAATQGKEMPI